MRGRKLKLGNPELAKEAQERYAKEKDGRRKNRLLAIKLVAKGEHTSAQIADLCGIARGYLFEWLKVVREKGLEALLDYGKPGPKKGSRRGISPQVVAELESKLAKGEFISAVAAKRWLKQAHGVERPYQTVWGWLKKAGGVLLVPRRSHSKKDPAAQERFPEELAEKLEALELPEGSRVKLWMMDEARFGLHTEIRRLWALKGQRPVVSHQMKYQWDYLYGALDIVAGQAHFCHIPSVNQHWDRIFLENLAATDGDAIHVLIRDQAGFHLRQGDRRLPAGVRIVNLPAYCPELNPCEQLWDIIKDEIANRVFATISELRRALLPALERFWNDPTSVLRLIGRDWLLSQANASHKTQMSY
jgi:transposase